MTSADTTPRPENLAFSLKLLIDEIIHVFPECSEGEAAEIEGRICLRLLEQAQQDAARLCEMMVPVVVRPASGSLGLQDAAGRSLPCSISIRQG